MYLIIHILGGSLPQNLSWKVRLKVERCFVDEQHVRSSLLSNSVSVTHWELKIQPVWEALLWRKDVMVTIVLLRWSYKCLYILNSQSMPLFMGTWLVMASWPPGDSKLMFSLLWEAPGVTEISVTALVWLTRANPDCYFH